jgi:hypothetical protein
VIDSDTLTAIGSIVSAGVLLIGGAVALYQLRMWSNAEYLCDRAKSGAAT